MTQVKPSILIALLVAGVLAPLVGRDEYFFHLMVMSGIFILLASSMDLLLRVGQFSLGHVAFFGIGAYISGLLSVKGGVPFIPAFVAAGIGAGVVGVAIALITMRLRGALFAIASLAFAEILFLISLNSIELTQGPMGLGGIRPPTLTLPFLGTIDFSSTVAYYYLVLLVVAATIYTIYKLCDSHLGRAMAAIKQNEDLALSVGINSLKCMTMTTAIAASIAGLAGSLYAHYVTFISPEVFSFSYTITMTVMVIAGGSGHLLGPVFGALFFVFLPEYLRAARLYREILYGVILIAVVLFMPQGFVPFVQEKGGDLIRWMERKRQSSWRSAG